MNIKILLTLPVFMPLDMVRELSRWANDGEPVNVYAIEYLRRTDSHMFDEEIYL